MSAKTSVSHFFRCKFPTLSAGWRDGILTKITNNM